jgi:hypothetical protein
VAYIPHTVRNILRRIIDKLSLVWRAVRNEGNTAVFLCLFTVAFLIPYFVLLATEGIPVFCLVLEIGLRLREVRLVC